MSEKYAIRPSGVFQFLLAVAAVGLAYAFALSANYIHAIQYVGGPEATSDRGLPPELFGMGSIASEFIAPVALISGLAAFRKATLKGFVVGVICLGVMIPALAWNARSIVGATANSIDRYISQQHSSVAKISRVEKQLDSVRSELHAEQDRLTFLSTQTFRYRRDRRSHANRVDATRARISALRQEEVRIMKRLDSFRAVATDVDAGSAALLRVLKDLNVIPDNVSVSTGAQYSALLLAGFLLLTTLFGPLLIGETMERVVIRRDELEKQKKLDADSSSASDDALGTVASPSAPALNVTRSLPAPAVCEAAAPDAGASAEPAQTEAEREDVVAEATETQTAAWSELNEEGTPVPEGDAETASSADQPELEALIANLIAKFPPKHPETIGVRGQRFARMIHSEFGGGSIVDMDQIKARWAEFHRQSRLPLGPHGDLVFSLIRAGYVCEVDNANPDRKICHVPSKLVEYGRLRVVA